MSNSHRAARAPKPAPGTTRRIVGNTLFIGGLVLCGGALVQPAQDAPSVLLTNGTTGGGFVGYDEWCFERDVVSGGSSGTTSCGRFERDRRGVVERDVGWFVGDDQWWFVGYDEWVVEW